MLRIIAALIMLFLLSAASARAADYYIDPVKGLDTNAGTKSAPWLTINKASTTMVAGDTAHAMPGTYGGANQSFSCSTTDFGGTSYACIQTSGAAGKPITFKSETKWGAKLVCNQNETFFVIQASWIVIDGFEITCPGTSPGSYGYAGGAYGNTGHNTWKNMYIHDMGVTACGQAGVIFIDNGVLSQGFNTYDSNIIHHWGNNDASFNQCLSSEGIYDGSPHATLTNNIMSGGAGTAIHSYGGGVCYQTISNNIVFDNSNGGIIAENTNGSGNHPVDICANSYTATKNIITNNIAINNGYGHDINGSPYNAATGGIHLYGDNMATDNTISDNLAFGNNPKATDMAGLQILATSPQRLGPNITNGNTSATFVKYQPDKNWAPLKAGQYNFLNYQLRPGSPGINNGTSLGAPDHDILGVRRPVCGADDIGAFEMQCFKNKWQPW